MDFSAKISNLIKICEFDQNVEFRLKMRNAIKIWKLDRNMEFCSNFWLNRVWSMWAQHFTGKISLPACCCNINSPCIEPVFMAGGHEKFHGLEGFKKCPIQSPPAVICRRNQYFLCHIECDWGCDTVTLIIWNNFLKSCAPNQREYSSF